MTLDMVIRELLLGNVPRKLRLEERMESAISFVYVRGERCIPSHENTMYKDP